MSNWAKLQEDTIGLPVFKRAKHGIHFKRADGLIQAEFTGKPVHYNDAGVWKPIDTKLLSVGNGWYGCPHSDVIIHPDGRVAVGAYVQKAALISPGTAQVDGDKIVREFSGGRQILRITERGGFRQEIVLEKMPDLKQVASLVDTVSGTLPTKYIASALSVKEADKEQVAIANATALKAYLESAKYPVLIDPDFNVQPDPTDGKDTWLYSGNQNDYGVNTNLASGGGFSTSRRTLIQFNVSSIASGSTITTAVISLYCNDNGSVNPANHSMHRMLVQWYEGNSNGSGDSTINNSTWLYRDKYGDGITWTDATGGGKSGSDFAATATGTTAVGSKDNWYDFDIMADVAAWVAGTATNYGNLLKGDLENDTNEYRYWYSSDYTTDTSLRPKLAVTYTAAAAGHPAVSRSANVKFMHGYRGVR